MKCWKKLFYQKQKGKNTQNSSEFCKDLCEEVTHWKRLWCWEELEAGGERDDRGWDGWMASLTRWTWVWLNSGSWWWTGRPGVQQFMGSQRVRKYWATVTQFSCSVMSDPLRPYGLLHARPPCPSPTPGVHSNSCPVSWWCNPTISSSVLSPSPPTFNLSRRQGLFRWVSSLHQLAKVLEFQLQHQSFQWIFRTDFIRYGLVGSPCCPRDSQESSPTPQFKSINSSALSFLYSPTLTSTHDHWKNHSFD